jgi:hypothetical protein
MSEDKDDRTFYVGYAECGCAVAVTVASGGRLKVGRREMARTIAEMIIHGYTIRHEPAIPNNFLKEVCTHGPTAEESGPREAYKCGDCGIVYDDEAEAIYCCAPTISRGFKCDACGKFYEGEVFDAARECCSKPATLAPADEPRCSACNSPLTAEDIADSMHVGTLLRCRTHILAVAPEMLTAEMIATGRAA